MDKVKKTSAVYGLLWSKTDPVACPARWHFHDLQELIDEPIVRGKIGIDIGAGCGYDTYIMGAAHPAVKVVGLDLSGGIQAARRLCAELKNTSFIRGSLLEMPLKDETFDFAYSFGVLHHTPDPARGAREIARILKNGAPLYLYLYEDHSENFAKFAGIKIAAFFRIATVRLPAKLLYALCFLFSPFVVAAFSWPAWMMKKFKATRGLAGSMPFNFGRHPFSLTGDLYDRLSAPIEYRFSRQQVDDLLSGSGFSGIKIIKSRNKAGWIAWGYKK